MTRQMYRGYEDARDAGLLTTGCDLRVHLVGAAFDAPVGAIHMDDIVTLDEFDGTGYVPYDATTVVNGWDDAVGRIWTCDNGAGDEFGTPDPAASVVPAGMIVRLYVDGTDANDYLLCWTDEGTWPDGNSQDMGLTLVDDILLYNETAA